MLVTALTDHSDTGPLSPGTTLGPYQIMTPVGEGGMGQVYRARDHRLEREVAIKVLPSRLTGDPAARRRFEREAKAIAALSHPNIVSAARRVVFPSSSWSCCGAKTCARA